MKKSKKALKKGSADSFLQKQAREKAAVGASKKRLGGGEPVAGQNVESPVSPAPEQLAPKSLPEDEARNEAQPSLPVERVEAQPPAVEQEEAPEPASEPESDGDRMRGSLIEHFKDLKRAVIRALACALVGFCVCFFYIDPILDVLTAPLIAAMPAGSHAMYTTLPEPFFMRMFVAGVAGVFLMSPLIFYQIWGFISPGLYESEKKFIVPVSIVSALFFVGGALFCFYVVFPFAFQFFMSFSTEQIQSVPKMSDYVDFVIKLLVAFGLIFEMPIFAFFLSRMGLVTAAMMRSVRPYAVVGVFIVAAILTPPDVVSQLLMAFPMLILYEASIFVAVIFGKKKKAEDVGQKEEGTEDKASA